MKRFLSILLAVAMTISMVLPVFAGSYTDTVGNDYEAAIEHLSGLGVINGYEDGSYQPEKVVTRAEMAKLMIVCLGLADGAELLAGESAFDDVPTSHWAIGYINVATQYGIIKGDGDGNFRPDDTVNYAETVTMALRALGYASVVEKAGQWPTNYINKANELKLFEDVENFKVSDGAKRGSVAQILWNMVGTEMWNVVSESEGNGLTSTKDRTMLETKFPDFTHKVGANYVANYEEGIITDMYVNDANEIVVEIGGVGIIYKNPEYAKVALVGSVAEAQALYTINKDGDFIGESLYIDESLVVVGTVTKVDAANDKVWVDGKEYKAEAGVLAGVNKFDVVTFDLDKDTKKVENVVAKYAMANDIIVKEIKTGSDGKVTYVAEKGTGANIVVDEDVNLIFVDFVTGKVYDKSVVKAGVSIAAPTAVATDRFVTVSTETISGKVSKINSVDGILTIDGNEYVLAADVRIKYEGRTNHEALTANGLNSLVKQTIKVKLNTMGEIVYIEASDDLLVDNYAFITKAWDEKVEGKTIYKVRLMDLNGKTADYETYNFDPQAKKSEQLGTTTVGTLIKYELKDGKVVAADDDGDAGDDTGIVKVTYLVAAAISNLNKTSQTFTYAAKSISYNSNTNFVEYLVKAADNKVELGSFKAADLDTAKTYVVIYDDNTNVAEYVLYKNTGDTLAEKTYAVIVEVDNTVDTENNSTVYGSVVYDIATGKEIELTTGDKIALAKGTVVEYSVKADGKYDIKAATKVDVAGAAFDADDDNYVYDSGDNTIIVLKTKEVITADAEVIFVNAAGEVETNKAIADITANDEVYGAVKLDKVGVDDAAVYTTIIVVVK